MSRIGDRVWQWILGLGIAAIAVGVAWRLKEPPRQTVPADQRVSIAEPMPVDLTVEQDGEVLIVRWDPSKATVSKATHGLLSVIDGDFERKIGLTSRDLSSGIARYAPLSRNVSFQLALYDGSASGKGSVLFLAREGRGAAPEQAPEPVSHTMARPRIAERLKKDTPRRKPRAENVDRRVKVEETLPKPAPLPPPAVEPLRELAVVVPEKFEAVPAGIRAPTPPPPAYRVTVTTQASRGTRFEQVLSKVPFVKRIARTPTIDELVKPVRRVEPEVSGGSEPVEALDASIEIEVDRSGNVRTARLVDLDRAPGNLEWAALRAAQSWQFEAPKARQSSWLVLTFHFEPAAGLRAE